MIEIEVIQPTKTKIKGSFDHVIIPGADGDFGVYKNHTPILAKLRPGILSLFPEKSTNIQTFAVHDGFAMVENNKITIICEVVEEKDEIDKDRAEKSKGRAEERLKGEQKDVDYRRAEIALKRALTRLEI